MTKTTAYKSCVFILMLFISMEKINAQTSITYSYDSNGNRDSVVLEASKSVSVSFPIVDKNIKPLEELTESEEGIKVFPNPTRGIINVLLENFKDQTEGSLMIFNLNGIVLKQMKINAPFTEVNVNDMPDGVYVMRLLINRQSLDYKIVKHN